MSMICRSVATAGLFVVAATQGLWADQKCAPRERVIERLNSQYGETRHSIGMAPNNAVVEVFASEESGTWTITATTAEGVTCLMASGQGFEKLTETLPVKGNEI